MSSHQVRGAGGQSGVFGITVRVVWVIVIALGLALVAHQPELSGTAQAQASPAPGAAEAAGQGSSDPSVPDAASVFAGRVIEPSPQIDTF